MTLTVTFILTLSLFTTTTYAFGGIAGTIESYIESFARSFIYGMIQLFNPSADQMVVTHVNALRQGATDIDDMIGVIEDGDTFGHYYGEPMPDFVMNIWVGGDYAETEEEAKEVLTPVISASDPIGNVFLVSIIDESMVAIDVEEEITCEEVNSTIFDGYWCSMTVIIEEDVKLYGDYDVSMELYSEENGAYTFEDDFEFVVGELMEIETPEHTDEFTVEDLPIDIDVRLEGVNEYRICSLDEEGMTILEDEYCIVRAEYETAWWDFFGLFYDDMSCEALDDYEDFDIEQGDIIHPQYCEAEFISRPHNWLEPVIQHVETGETVRLEPQYHLNDGVHNFEIKHKHLMELREGHDQYLWDEFQMAVHFHDIGASTFWDSYARLLSTYLYK